MARAKSSDRNCRSWRAPPNGGRALSKKRARPKPGQDGRRFGINLGAFAPDYRTVTVNSRTIFAIYSRTLRRRGAKRLDSTSLGQGESSSFRATGGEEAMEPVHLFSLIDRQQGWLSTRQALVAQNIANVDTPYYRAFA